VTRFPVPRAFLRYAQDKLCPCTVTAKMAVPHQRDSLLDSLLDSLTSRLLDSRLLDFLRGRP
jgi:hypothetical protein